MQIHNEDQNRWAIILAGGKGKRLSSLTRRIAGDARPKQFCSVIGDTSLDRANAWSRFVIRRRRPHPGRGDSRA